jgi:hypothetical protein
MCASLTWPALVAVVQARSSPQSQIAGALSRGYNSYSYSTVVFVDSDAFFFLICAVPRMPKIGVLFCSKKKRMAVGGVTNR